MTIVHICHHCRKAVGTVGPYEDIVTCGEYFICHNCYVKQEDTWERIKAACEWEAELPVDGD